MRRKVTIHSNGRPFTCVYMFDCDNGDGFDIYDDENNHIGEMWGYLPDEDDDDSETLKSFEERVCEWLETNFW